MRLWKISEICQRRFPSVRNLSFLTRLSSVTPLPLALPRPPGCPAQHSGNAPSETPSVHESPHPPLPAAEPASRLSSDEGECDEKEEPVEKLDCHYSGHHPQPAAVRSK